MGFWVRKGHNRQVVRNAVSSNLVAEHKKKPGNALFKGLPRLYATIQTRFMQKYYGFILL